MRPYAAWSKSVVGLLLGTGCSFITSTSDLTGGAEPTGPSLDAATDDASDAAMSPDTPIANVDSSTDAPSMPDAAPLTAPQFISASKAPPVSASTLGIDAPLGIKAGDFLFATVFGDYTGQTITAPVGWVERTHANLVCMSSVYWFTHVVTAAEPTEYAFTLGSFSDYAAGAIVAYRGIDTATPFDVDLNTKVPGNPYASAPLTTTRANDLILMGVGNDSGNGGMWTAPTGMVMRANTGLVAIFEATQAAPGPTPAYSAACSIAGCGAIELAAFRFQ